ncbi:MAG: phage portal protein [Eubacteriales bacterium]|nr:phage portal protein [Eubacteriales bacterium]
MLKLGEIEKFISEDKTSTSKRMARIGQKYYDGEHDILDYRMFYFNSDGKLVEDDTRSNVKIPHPFFTELVDQTVQYMLSGKDGLIKSDLPELQDRLNEYFDDDFICELNDVLTGTQAKGFEYMYVYMNKDGKLSFECADSLGVIEVREKDSSDGKPYVIYYYDDRLMKENKTITMVQVWNDKDTTFYIIEDGKIVLDDKEPINPRPHILYHKDGDDATYYDYFGFIPFFRLDNNKKQWSGLHPIKDLIDDYDMMSCGLSNNLADFDHPIHVVKGFQGDNLDELQKNLKTKKMIGVDSDGGVEVHTVDVPYQARLTKMQEDEKNIYRFGMGFNSAQLGDGNVTNVVIKSRYALLDLKCNKLEIRMKQFLKKIIKVVIDDINKNDGTDYQVTDVWFNFEREVMTNAQDNATIEKIDAEKKKIVIETMLELQNVLDDETIIQAICETLDVDYESIKDKLPEDDMMNNQQALDMVEGGAVIE